MQTENQQFESCPICHNALIGIEPFCPVCSYEIHRSPSEYIREEEEKRKELHAKIYERYLECVKKEQEKKELETKIEELSKKVKDQTTLVSDTPVATVKRVGYLIMQDRPGSTPYDIFPVNEGLNIYGNNPTPVIGSYCHVIANLSPNLQPNHFSINTKANAGFEAKILNGSWSVDSKNNCPNSIVLANGTTLFFDDFILTFVEHYE